MADEPGMEGGTIKKFLFLNRKAPHGTIYALESLEVVLISAAFEQDVSLMFMDDGIFQLRKGWDTTNIGTKNFLNTYKALEMYDVEKLYVCKEDLEDRGLTEDDLVVPVEVLDRKQVGELMDQQDVVLSF
jgi:tRNA 2-thiouridine synthesizing protein C